MGKTKTNQFDIHRYDWFKLDLVKSDRDTSFQCPSCGATSRFSHEEVSRKIPKSTGQLEPIGQTVRLTNGFPLFYSQIYNSNYDRQPLIRIFSLFIGIGTIILLMLWWRQVIYEGGSVPWYIGSLAVFGGWVTVRFIQPILSPKLSLWRFNCSDCGAGYAIATDGNQARIGDNKGRIVDGYTPGNQTHTLAKKVPEVKSVKTAKPVFSTHTPMEKVAEVKSEKTQEPDLPRMSVSRKAVKTMAENRDVEQLIQVAKRGGLVAQLTAGKALLEIDDIGGLDALLNETALGRYYTRAILQLEAHKNDPRAIEALRRAVSKEVELSKTRLSTPPIDGLNKVRCTEATKALNRLGIK